MQKREHYVPPKAKERAIESGSSMYDFEMHLNMLRKDEEGVIGSYNSKNL